jgi:hypothetical protein
MIMIIPDLFNVTEPSLMECVEYKIRLYEDRINDLRHYIVDMKIRMDKNAKELGPIFCNLDRGFKFLSDAHETMALLNLENLERNMKQMVIHDV